MKKPVLKPNELSTRGRRYPVRPDKKDKRDKLVHSLLAKPVTLPLTRCDLSQYLGPVKDQGQLGACTGFAYAGIREFLNNKKGPLPAGTQPAVFAPLYLYYKERQLENNINEDSGAEPRDGCKVLLNSGVCLENQDQYNIANYQTAPTPEMETEAGQYKILSYHRAMNLQELKNALAQGLCASVAMDVYESFEGNYTASSGEMKMPAKNEDLLGGHEVIAFGYDDNHTNYDNTKGAVHIRNSWGATWGQSGNFWMPYSYVVPKYVSDIWVPMA
jgi:C1A family cysteine protease